MRPAALAAAIAALFLPLTLTGVLAQTCSPFGNPPVTFISNIVPKCTGGQRLGPWNDAAGTPRYACLYEPPQAAPDAPLPLVVYLHPSLSTADNVRTNTNLLGFLKTANVSDDFSRPGFILLAPEGRDTTHYYSTPDKMGPGWDNWYRQFNPAGEVTVGGMAYPENLDATTIDHFIAAEQESGKVDPDRTYLTGWSNGSAMAYIYGLSRPNVAAIAVYSSPDPFQLVLDPCPQTPVTGMPTGDDQLQIFNLQAPTYQVHNNCDIAGICPNAELLEGQLLSLGGSVADSILGTTQQAVVGCNPACGTNPNGDLNNKLANTQGVLRHLHWPNAWTGAMLDFFRRHPLSAHP
jgi:dienelactone hydrolase